MNEITTGTTVDGFSISFDEERNLFTVKNSARRSHTSLRSVLSALRREMNRRRMTKSHLLLDWTEFKGFDPDREEDLKADEILIAELIRRLAIVVGEEWEQEARRILDVFPYLDGKLFGTHERPAAERWLLEDH